MSGARPLVRLWRVEHRTLRCGPFNNADRDIGKEWPYCWPVGVGMRPRSMPSFGFDRLLRDPTGGLASRDPWRTYGPHTRFAWYSEANVRKWVDRRAALIADLHDFVVRLVAVPWDQHVRLAEQAVYHSGHAVELRTLRLPEVVPEVAKESAIERLNAELAAA